MQNNFPITPRAPSKVQVLSLPEASVIALDFDDQPKVLGIQLVTDCKRKIHIAEIKQTNEIIMLVDSKLLSNV
jgi:hypothetical protein